MGPHVTITHGALDFTVQGCHLDPLSLPIPHSQSWPPDIRHMALVPMVVTSGGHYWRPDQTRSIWDPLLPDSNIFWPKHIWLESKQCTSHWNGFLVGHRSMTLTI